VTAECGRNSSTASTEGSEGWPTPFLGQMEEASFVDGQGDDSSAWGGL
jgi:hypothetical protein